MPLASAVLINIELARLAAASKLVFCSDRFKVVSPDMRY